MSRQQETQRLVGGFPTTTPAQYTGYESMGVPSRTVLPFLAEGLASIPVDEQILAELESANTSMQHRLLLALTLLLAFPIIVLLSLRPQWESLPPTLFLGFTKQFYRTPFILSPLITLLLGLLSIRYLLGPSALFPTPPPERLPGAFPCSPDTPSPLLTRSGIPLGLPLSPSLLCALSSLLRENAQTLPDSSLDDQIDTLTWWANHPSTTLQRAHLLSQAILITLTYLQLTLCGVFTNILEQRDLASTWFLLSLVVFGTPMVYFGLVSFLMHDLRMRPVEYRGIGEGAVVGGVDVRRVVVDAEREADLKGVAGLFGQGLSPEEQEFYQKYGKLPVPKKDLLGKRLNGDRKYFDSGDYALCQAGKSSAKDLGSQHPSPERIPHSNPMAQTAVAAGKESSLVHEANKTV
ncbi:hypothetical protein HDU98_001854 [Podochytrium sp. JEL0797]|nr:hypothetical protein HDU98_001854 [Podochytrium sp. JEL0797]